MAAPPTHSLVELELMKKGPQPTLRSALGGGDAHDDDHEEGKALRMRRCTDPLCLFVFIAHMGGMGYLFHYAKTNGNIDKITHGFDWEGRICSVDEGVKDKPLLYWCVSGGTQLLDSICVDKCPSDTSGKNRCPGVPVITHAHHTDGSGAETREITVKRTLTEVENVPTEEVLGMYCLPTQNNDLMAEILKLPGVSSYTSQIYAAMDGIAKGWKFLFAALIIAVLFSYMFLFALRVLVKPFIILLFAAVFFALLLAALVSVVLGLPSHYAQIVTHALHLDPSVLETHNPWRMVSEDHAQRYALYTGGALTILWFLFSCCWCFARKGINVTCDAISRSCGAIAAMPTLLLQPVLQVVLIVSVGSVMLVGFGWVMSLGHVVTANPMADPETGVAVAGIDRKFVFKQWQWLALAFWAFGSVWTVELVKALGQFSISHAMVAYTFQGRTTCLPLTQGYVKGFVFHLGSLAFGAFIMGILSIATAILSYLAKQTRGADGKRNMTVTCCFACCLCCLSCMESVMRLVNQMVYVDICIEGKGYLKSSWNVWTMALKNPVTAATLAGATKVVKFMGVMIIGGGGTFVSYKLVNNPEVIKSFILSASSTLKLEDGLNVKLLDGASSVLYTSSVLGTTIACGFICFGVAASFMTIFDMAADSIAYCQLWKSDKSADDSYRAMK
eukprot:TRINITY_DN2499_c0_g1_i1.p1 TRINITY_DN2499_c0_g1~~TRINITY_DN2499_c0_g1_i1.p1  ORF type:complete len:673 (+),score=100.14 TRINITY_DN2499_c0_g1_i1:161-2179(+)